MGFKERTIGETVESCHRRCEERKTWCRYFYHVSELIDGACHLYSEEAENCTSDGNKQFTKYSIEPCVKEKGKPFSYSGKGG